MKAYEHVGVSAPIHNAGSKITGAEQYYGDFALPNLHYAKLVYSAIPHGTVKKIHTGEAEKITGVVKILTCFNTTDKLFCRSRVLASEQSCLQERLFPQTVRFVGDRVAVVIAQTAKAAQAAAERITVEYEPLPAAVTVEQASAAGAPRIYPEGNVYPFEGITYGSLPEETGLISVESGIHLGALHHAALEPHGCVAAYNKGTQKLTLYTPCQSVFAIRTGLGDLFGLPYGSIEVIQTTMGGSFGCKQETILEPVAAACALAVGAPVKLALTREEVIASTIVRAPMDFTAKALTTPGGQIKSIAVDCTIQAGAYLTNSLDYLSAMGDKLSRLYDFQHIRFTGRAVCTNTPVSGSYRSWGSNDIALAVEHLLGRVARRCNVDLVQLHQINALPPHSPHRLGGIGVGDLRIKECFAQGEAAFQWQQRKAACQAWNAGHSRVKKGVGMAGGAHANGFYPGMEFAYAGLRLNEDGSVSANICLHDHGCGTITAFQKIIAEALSVDEATVRILPPDTHYNHYDYGCYGSRTTYVIGKAAQNCAESLLQQIKQKAAALLQQPVEQLLQQKASFAHPGSHQTLTYARIAQAYQEQNQEITAAEHYRAVDNPTSSGAAFAQVAVDTLTGLTKVEAYYTVYDIGQAVNPAMCRAQIGGAVQQGIGAALLEEIRYHPQTGAIQNTNLHQYHLVNLPDMPKVEIEFIQHPGDNGPYSAKSIGEIAVVPVSPAILAAVEHALNREVESLPVTPIKTIDLLQRQGGR